MRRASAWFGHRSALVTVVPLSGRHVNHFWRLLRALRIPAFIAVPALALVMYEVIALLFYKDTMRTSLPARETLEFLRVDLRLVWTQFPEAVAPVPSEGSYLVAATFGIGLRRRLQ